MNHQDFYYALKEDQSILKDFTRRLLQIFELLSFLDIVHADLKPDNILVSFDGSKITDLKLIDFGSAFIFSEARSIPATTPEYLAPEVLSFMDK